MEEIDFAYFYFALGSICTCLLLLVIGFFSYWAYRHPVGWYGKRATAKRRQYLKELYEEEFGSEE